jgi:hypothetical protein
MGDAHVTFSLIIRLKNLAELTFNYIKQHIQIKNLSIGGFYLVGMLS